MHSVGAIAAVSNTDRRGLLLVSAVQTFTNAQCLASQCMSLWQADDVFLEPDCLWSPSYLSGCTRQAALERQDLSCTYLARQ